MANPFFIYQQLFMPMVFSMGVIFLTAAAATATAM